MRCWLVKYSGLLLLILSLLNPVDVFAAKMTNDDVIKLVRNGMSENLIIKLIANSETAFDTSTNAIIALSKKRVSQKIISAMIAPQKEETKNSLKDKGQPDVQKINPEEVIILDNGQEKAMTYVIPEMKTSARALGFGGFATYAVMKGDHAQLRITNKTPSFLISAPKNVQPNSHMTLISLAFPGNGSREVVPGGGGWMSHATGIHPDRIMPIIFEKVDDQSRATKDFVLYKITSKNPLVPGEYALVLSKKEAGNTGPFAQGASPYFDFGVD